MVHHYRKSQPISLQPDMHSGTGMVQGRAASCLPYTALQIDWQWLIEKRPMIHESLPSKISYLLMPEILDFIAREADPAIKLVLELMWCTGGRISEVLALTRERIKHDGFHSYIVLDTLKQPGRPKATAKVRSPKRYIPIWDPILIERLQTYIHLKKGRASEKLFTMCRQTVYRHIQKIAKQLGGYSFSICNHTFRHSFAIHMLLHGRPQRVIAKWLGHSDIRSTNIYTDVLTLDSAHFMEGVYFH